MTLADLIAGDVFYVRHSPLQVWGRELGGQFLTMGNDVFFTQAEVGQPHEEVVILHNVLGLR